MNEDTAGFSISRLATNEQAAACATIMCTSEPWVTLKRSYETALGLITDTTREVFVALHNEEVVGFLLLSMQGALSGYIQTVAVRADWRGQGLGTRLIEFAEKMIFRVSPNAFLCVSSFNTRARDLYARLGYETIGEMKDYVVRGHSEWLLRKTISPVTEFRRT
jgi:[ribosomal protein S18]-alanine N-acetyltransferase